jgi:2-keto-4-pentenoate hydratase/2-oxohepta-3-ene-1,7-dioic acid hydratase in catechol pathway
VHYKGHVFFAGLGEGEVFCLNHQLGFSNPIVLSDVLLMPLVTPSKIICVHNNFQQPGAMSVARGGHLPFYLKPPSALAMSGQPIIIPHRETSVNFGASLALIIGQTCRHIRPEEAPRHIFGYTCANDIFVGAEYSDTCNITREKAYDTFCPLCFWLETDEPDPAETFVRCLVNGELKQSGRISDMINAPHEVVSLLSQVMTLHPGDLVLTGTPPGAGALMAGDAVQVEITGVGVLGNKAQAEQLEHLLPIQ